MFRSDPGLDPGLASRLGFRNLQREAEYDRLGVEHQTNPLNDAARKQDMLKNGEFIRHEEYGGNYREPR